MHLSEIRLFNFRNLQDRTYQLSSGVTAIIGDNGQGKSNFIEAISLLSHTRSFRTNSIDEVIRQKEEGCSVFGLCINKDHSREIGISVDKDGRHSFVDGKESSGVSGLLGILSCITFAPSDLSLVKGSPQIRRRFIDRHVVDMDEGMIKTFLSYQRAIKQKGALLKSGSATKDALSAWNKVLSPLAADIINARYKLVTELQTCLREISVSLFGNPDAVEIKISGSGKLRLISGESDVTPEMVFEHLEDGAVRELARSSTVVGPHRDDLLISLMGQEAKAFASQGQSRSIILALKIGVIELIERITGESPVVLLDDVDSELDKHRREAIFSSIFLKERQIFITATEFRLPKEGIFRTYSTYLMQEGSMRLISDN